MRHHRPIAAFPGSFIAEGARHTAGGVITSGTLTIVPGDQRDFEEAEAEFASAARPEVEDAGREAALLQMRRRELADVATEFMRRGDSVTVTAGERSFTRRVTHAVGDLMTLETSAECATCR